MRAMISVLFLAPLLLSVAVNADERLPMADPEEVGMSSERLQRIDTLMQEYIDADLLAGTVTLVARGGKVVHLAAYGDRYVEEDLPMGTDDIFVIMSMTKPIVSTALMMLHEEGKFLLTDPVTKWIPEIAGKEVLLTDELGTRRVPAERPITVRHILTHTSGVDPDRRLLTQEELDQLPGFQNRGRVTLEESILRRASLPLNFQPGERWQYGSSTNYVALLVQRISGQNMDDFLRERIFEPLGMYDTYYNVPESKVDRTAAVYSPGEDGKIKLRRAPEYRETKYFGGVAGLSSTAADYWRFHQMILNGGEFDGVRLLSPKTIDLMITNHIGDLEVTLRGPGYGFGLGYSMLTDPGKAKESLTPGSFGWGGAYCTYFFVDPAEDMIGIFMTQISPYRHLDVRQQFSTLATQAIVESWRDRPAAIRAYPVPD